MLPSLNPPANHLNTCLILGRSLSLRHSNHSCVIYSCPSGEHKECNLANPIRRQNQSDRPRCWEIFAWLWTCVLAGKGSDVSLNSVGNPHGLFPLLFTWALGNARAPKPQVLSLSAWQHETHQDCFEKKNRDRWSMLDCYGCQGSALNQGSLSLQCICDFRWLKLYGIRVTSTFSHLGPPRTLKGEVSPCTLTCPVPRQSQEQVVLEAVTTVIP